MLLIASNLLRFSAKNLYFKTFPRRNLNLDLKSFPYLDVLTISWFVVAKPFRVKLKFSFRESGSHLERV